ncbi:MAG: hypothetical protein ABFS56_22685 [Pseudomonadota bacterium]
MKEAIVNAVYHRGYEPEFGEVTLPIHPRFLVRHALQEASYLWAIGEKEQGFNHLKRAFDKNPSSGALASQLIEYAFVIHHEAIAKQVIATFEQTPNPNEAIEPYLTMVRLLIDKGKMNEVNDILKRLPPQMSADDFVQLAAISER